MRYTPSNRWMGSFRNLESARSGSIPISSPFRSGAIMSGAKNCPPARKGLYWGLVLLFSTESGEPLAILPDGVMQRMRVGAANGLGVKHLARADARTVGILGSGWQ